MSDGKSRRRFLKTALVSAGAAAGLFATVKFDAADGIKIGKSSVKIGMSEANAVCGTGMGCQQAFINGLFDSAEFCCAHISER